MDALVFFAQFERKINDECIRDKIAASKKRGLWAGAMKRLFQRVGHLLRRVREGIWSFRDAKLCPQRIHPSLDGSHRRRVSVGVRKPLSIQSQSASLAHPVWPWSQGKQGMRPGIESSRDLNSMPSDAEELSRSETILDNRNRLLIRVKFWSSLWPIHSMSCA